MKQSFLILWRVKTLILWATTKSWQREEMVFPIKICLSWGREYLEEYIIFIFKYLEVCHGKEV